jgi:hypothetical protein
MVCYSKFSIMCRALSILMVFVSVLSAQTRVPIDPDYQYAAGRSEISPASDMLAGSFGTWTVTFTAGTGGIPTGGALQFGLYRSGWSTFQLDRPRDAGYTTFETNARIEYSAQVIHEKELLERDLYNASREWFIEVTITKGTIQAGDKFSMTYGDRSGGGSGGQVWVVPYDFHETVKRSWPTPVVPFNVRVDRDGKQDWRSLKEENVYDISVVGGPAEKLEVIAKTNALVGNPTRVGIVAVNHHNDLADFPAYTGTVRLTSTDPNAVLPSQYTFASSDESSVKFHDIVFATPGVHRVTAKSLDGKLIGESNPIIVRDTKQEHQVLWGDLHGHTEVWDGLMSIEYALKYARDHAQLDYVGLAEHGSWDEVEYWTNQVHNPPEFTAIQCYEAQIPGGSGHRNFYTAGDTQPPSEKGKYSVDEMAAMTLDEFRTALASQSKPKDPWGFLKGKEHEVLMVPHATLWSEQAINWDYRSPTFHRPEFQSVTEIYSCWGSNEKWKNPLSWETTYNTARPKAISAQSILAGGHKVGFIGSGDSHTGRLGLSRENTKWADRHDALPQKAGFAAIYATENTREAIWQAIHERRCYATTGERIVVEFGMDGLVMGQELRMSNPREYQPRFKARVVGTADIESVTLVCNNQDLYVVPGKGREVEFEYVDLNMPFPQPSNWYYLRVIQKDGNWAWASPIWVTHDPSRKVPAHFPAVRNPNGR